MMANSKSSTGTKPGTATKSSTGTKLWIANGIFWILLATYIWGAWLLGPDFKENTFGREAATPGYVLWIRCLEVVSVVLALWQLAQFVVLPKLRSGRLSVDGIFFLACWTLYLQEPWLNYNNHQFLYTTVSYNRGCWCRYVPGWNSPNAELIPVASLIWFTSYLTLVGLWVFAGAKFMGWWKSKRPNVSPLELILTTFLLFIPFDFVLEYMILSTGLFNYASTLPQLTLWAGQKNQFPLYEIVIWCATLTAWTSVRYFTNDRGETWAERGLSAIKFPSEGLKTCTRFAVIMGSLHLLFILFYNLPYFYFSTKGGAFPAYEPYRVAGVCGPHTNFDCPGLTTPVPKRDSFTNRTVPPGTLPMPVIQSEMPVKQSEAPASQSE